MPQGQVLVGGLVHVTLLLGPSGERGGPAMGTNRPPPFLDVLPAGALSLGIRHTEPSPLACLGLVCGWWLLPPRFLDSCPAGALGTPPVLQGLIFLMGDVLVCVSHLVVSDSL